MFVKAREKDVAVIKMQGNGSLGRSLSCGGGCRKGHILEMSCRKDCQDLGCSLDCEPLVRSPNQR